MKSLRTWTLATAIALLAGSDWFAANAPADGKAGGPSVTVGKATVTTSLKTIEVDGKKQTHAFLDIAGEGAGTITVRLQETKINPDARMMPRPVTAWSKEIAIDSAKSTSIDLGIFVEEANVRRSIQAAVDGKTFVALLNSKGMKSLDE